MTENEKLIEISKILTAWNPLGERDAAVKNLDNYNSKIKAVLEK